MPLLEYQPRDPLRPPPRSLRRRLFTSAWIGLGGVVLNLVALVVAIDTRLLFPFFMVSGPCALALFVIDRPLDLHHHVPKEVIWVLLVLASAAQYTVYGLLLNLRFPGRRLVLVLLLLFHVGSGVFLHVSGVQ